MRIVLIIAGIEVLLFLCFWVMGLYRKAGIKRVFVSVLKGWIERAFLCYGLHAGVPLVILLFSALKLGTRFKEEHQNRISNDQFLVGNLLSVAAAIIYSQLITGF